MHQSERFVPDLQPGKFCYYVDPTQDTRVYGGYVPSVVIEGESGHYPMLGQGEYAAPWVWGTDLKLANQCAIEKNHDLGLTEERVAQIIASSMQASMRGRKFTAGRDR
jgi:hypothetical protein